jgi:hypothetical protein
MALENQGEQKTKPDISFVKKTGHFNLSTTGGKNSDYEW